MTSVTAAALRAEFLSAREQGLSPYRRALAYEAWFRQMCKDGFCPDALQRYSPVEAERFWARTVPGPDGHVYWTGGKDFYRNASAVPRGVRPARWVWMQEHGPIATTDSVTPICGEEHCVALPHLKCERREGLPAFIPDDRLIGRLQVVAMELGRTPSSKEWAKRGETPTVFCYQRRWGSWDAAITSAGLAPVVHANILNRVTPEQALDSLRQAIKDLGRLPQRDEYREWSQGAPDRVGQETLRRRFNNADWPTILALATNPKGD